MIISIIAQITNSLSQPLLGQTAYMEGTLCKLRSFKPL